MRLAWADSLCVCVRDTRARSLIVWKVNNLVKSRTHCKCHIVSPVCFYIESYIAWWCIHIWWLLQLLLPLLPLPPKLYYMAQSAVWVSVLTAQICCDFGYFNFHWCSNSSTSLIRRHSLHLRLSIWFECEWQWARTHTRAHIPKSSVHHRLVFNSFSSFLHTVSACRAVVIFSLGSTVPLLHCVLCHCLSFYSVCQVSFSFQEEEEKKLTMLYFKWTQWKNWM